MDVLSLNQRFIRELLGLYKDLPAVWKLKSPEYKNKAAKGRAYDLMVKKCREYVPDADREFVKNKINSLRTSFRKERRKVEHSKGTNSADIYVPSLWYYNLLTFTVDPHENTPSSSAPKLDSAFFENQESSSHDEPGFLSFKDEPTSPTHITIDKDPFASIQDHQVSGMKSHSETLVLNQPVIHDDVFDAIGKNVAHKLRGMSEQQRIISEKIISDVMYHGQMEMLTVDAHLTLNQGA